MNPPPILAPLKTGSLTIPSSKPTCDNVWLLVFRLGCLWSSPGWFGWCFSPSVCSLSSQPNQLSCASRASFFLWVLSIHSWFPAAATQTHNCLTLKRFNLLGCFIVGPATSRLIESFFGGLQTVGVYVQLPRMISARSHSNLSGERDGKNILFLRVQRGNMIRKTVFH